ncbi:unnamed protein product [Periconia digitata]|uniref:Uncharacterized protein n=1 Tax=Periconia digitata TaxID=1303443 RepID=A0A9W4UUD0_9PLEO|nr:unnamed protein product [Periconia digitata]
MPPPPLRADTLSPPSTSSTSRRPVPRIIPAIPRRFARPAAAAKPTTPDDSKAAPALAPAPPPVDDKKTERAHTPSTSESKASPSAEKQALPSSTSPSTNGNAVGEVVAADTIAGAEQKGSQQTDSKAARDSAIPNGHRPKSTVRTELPPEFYPREKSSTHSPFSDGVDAPFLPPPQFVPVHRFQQSVEGIVFGGAVQESPAMPSTPQEFESDMHVSQPNFTRPPPGFAPHMAPQFFPGHSHHPSDPAASWLQPAYSMGPPPEVIYGNGHGYTSPTFAPGSASFQAAFPAPFPPPNAAMPVNGATRSHSQSPSKSHFEDAKPAPYLEDEPVIPYTNGSAPRQFGAPGEIHTIARHVFGLFGNPEFADCILHVRFQDTVLLAMPVHAAIVSRSPAILESIRRSASPSFRTKDPRRLAEVTVDNIFVSYESSLEAIKILYGGPLLSPPSFLFGLTPYLDGSDQGFVSSEARRRLGQVISYIAAGSSMQIPEMQSSGLRVAKALLRWDTIEELLHFCLTETCAMPLLNEVVGFIAHNLPSDFSLYSLAPELRHYPRLPTVTEPNQGSHNPRLSKIQFGDAPAEDEGRPSHITQVLSSILLTIPLPLLDQIFGHPALANPVTRNNLVKIMRDVIEEREARRQKASKAELKLSPDGTVAQRLLENLRHQERMELSNERPSGFALISTREAESM